MSRTIPIPPQEYRVHLQSSWSKRTVKVLKRLCAANTTRSVRMEATVLLLRSAMHKRMSIKAHNSVNHVDPDRIHLDKPRQRKPLGECTLTSLLLIIINQEETPLNQSRETDRHFHVHTAYLLKQDRIVHEDRRPNPKETQLTYSNYRNCSVVCRNRDAKESKQCSKRPSTDTS